MLRIAEATLELACCFAAIAIFVMVWTALP